MSERPERYEPSAIEPKWQKYWEENQTFKAVRHPGREKMYVLDMFPYPSGSGLHVGHPEGYTATDIVSRYKRMCGVDVLHPMGWDAFGLPAEQYAIQTGTHPRETTQRNIDTFRRQLKSLGFSYDWSREIDTTDPNYVKWTQWIFLQLFKKGLAFQDKIPVNWCAELGTVLANEEVIDGKSERGGYPVERLPLRQWLLRITEYADRLDADLEGLDWPETREKQRYWIGRSEGAEIHFALEGNAKSHVSVFTTRPDTLPGVTYVVLAPEHPLALEVTTKENLESVTAYIASTKSKSDRDRTDLSKTKTGVPTGAFVTNPVNGDRVPLWIGDYVIGSYGTGAVMAVPAHDERDHAFAKTYGLPVVQVVAPAGRAPAWDFDKAAFTDDGVAHGCKGAAGIEEGAPSADVRKRVIAFLESKGAGKSRVTYRLRDWVFSRQRYWGEPMPIYFPVDTKGDPRIDGTEFTIDYGTPIAVDESELPVRLPDLADFKPSGDPAGPLARVKDWRFFQKDGKWFARETNTMPQWAGSCWYYLRFADPTNAESLCSAEAQKSWLPVDLYMGGSEHAVLHLLYARFWHKVLYDAKIVADREPFLKLVHQGVILGENNEKMSKSAGNVVNPDDVVKSHGADSLRVYEMFMGPLEATKPWQMNGVEGVRRFLDRVYQVCAGEVTEEAVAYDDATKRLVHKTVEKVRKDIEGLRFNTAISAMMILSKHLLGLPKVPKEAAKSLTLILAPFAPHLAEELWSYLGGTKTLAFEPWPAVDPALLVDDTVEIGVQVNGKLRGTVQLATDATESAAKEAALADEKVRAQVEGKTLKKLVYVPGRILNFIVG
ncbi:MAG: leucine--tRNA ligase [Polyangiaceae bacterium]